MAQVPLIQGFYEAQSIIAGAQRCLNLYPERNAQDAPFPFTHYLTPGLTPQVTPEAAEVRCLYTATNGVLWAVIGQDVYWLDSTFTATLVGSITSTTGPVSMKDNRLVLILVDNTSAGYVIDMGSLAMSPIWGGSPPSAWLGSTSVWYTDTFFLFVQPQNTGNFSPGGVLSGNLTDFGAGAPDGTYENVTLADPVDPPGTGFQATITVSGGEVVSLIPTANGAGYSIGDSLTTQLGGQPTTNAISSGPTGCVDGNYSGITFTGVLGQLAVGTVTVSGGTPTAVTFTGGMGYGTGHSLISNYTFGGLDVADPLVVAVSGVTANAGAAFLYTVAGINQGVPGSNLFYISLGEVTYANLTGGPVVTADLINAGTGYPDGNYAGVSLTTDPSLSLAQTWGEGLMADITVASGAVVTVSIADGGENFRVGDVLTAQLGAQPNAGNITYAPPGCLQGNYTNVAFTGGSGQLLAGTVTVGAAGLATGVTFTAGMGSTVGDVLYADASLIGGTFGNLTYTVSGITSAGSGFGYAVLTTGSSAFDPLDFVEMTGDSDGISNLAIVNRQVWLIGNGNYGEIWYNAGTPDFAFGRWPGVAVQHGSSAIYSLVVWDVALYWLGVDDAGQQQVYRGANYQAEIISTPAISNAISGYAVVADAIGYIYQERGHVFYVLTFPTADATWVYDITERLWHERRWSDTSGFEHRHRSNCQAFAYGQNVVGDWETGAIYTLDPTNFQDAGQPIQRRRGFPHILNQSNRISVSRFLADMDVGQATGLTTDEPPQVSLNISRTKGASWEAPRIQSVGSTGQYWTNIQYRQIGMGRDFVFELFWDFPYFTALNGAWLEAIPART